MPRAAGFGDSSLGTPGQVDGGEGPPGKGESRCPGLRGSEARAER